MFQKIRQIMAVAAYDFYQWKGNPRIVITFALAFILCFLLSDQAVSFAAEQGTALQILEPFIWTFGDSLSLLLASILLIFLFSDMPFLYAASPFYLVRTSRRVWLAGQVLYIGTATLLYLLFTLASTVLLSMKNAFAGNLWSPTAVILGYMDSRVILPSSLKTMTMTTPCRCAATIFLLMLLYSLTMALGMLAVNLMAGQSVAIAAAIVFSIYGFLLRPELFMQIFSLSEAEKYKANVAVGWLSPLNHATYPKHNFGYDLLPRLWQTYLVFGILLLTAGFLCVKYLRRYNFSFTGTEM